MASVFAVFTTAILCSVSLIDGRQPLHEPPPGYPGYNSGTTVYQPWPARTTPGPGVGRRVGSPARQGLQGGSLSSAQGPIAELGGWGVSFPESYTSKAIISLQTVSNPRACLDACQTTLGCRFVSFNLDNNRCSGYTGAFDGVFRPNSSSTLLAATAKRFARTRGAAIAGDFIEGSLTATDEAVANGKKVFNEDVCLLLCRVHPKCLAVHFKAADFTMALPSSGEVECGLAWNVNKLTADRAFSSYISA
ncbi:hypothetical protein BV898_03077 [Hypsibius exemplaris]|uniref:Apple domain-containing protein n=1 Tax=Hypsibius exemplaris TaxID=2072580 RepID=A0A1W0X6K9_HYPEX|nr:hypothetical protein BV898_03077 [Hypsibius exemplaris]